MDTEDTEDTDSMITVLYAHGPHPDLADQLMLFGQFVGAWDVDVTIIRPDGVRTEGKAEWHFGWALEGRAVMDVWIAPRRSLRGPSGSGEYGVVVRIVDPQSDVWRCTYIGPAQGVVMPFVARKVEDEIILEGCFEGGTSVRWIFSHMTATRFRWRALESRDGGATWITTQEMIARRAAPAAASGVEESRQPRPL